MRELNGGPTSSSEEFHVDEVRPEHGTVVLAVHGDADLHVAGELKDMVGAAIEDGADVLVLDLSSTTFLDSFALGVLLGGMKRLRARGGRFRIVAPRSDIRRIFEMTLLDRVFEIDTTREESLSAATAGAGP